MKEDAQTEGVTGWLRNGHHEGLPEGDGFSL